MYSYEYKPCNTVGTQVPITDHIRISKTPPSSFAVGNQIEGIHAAIKANRISKNFPAESGSFAGFKNNMRHIQHILCAQSFYRKTGTTKGAVQECKKTKQ